MPVEGVGKIEMALKIFQVIIGKGDLSNWETASCILTKHVKIDQNQSRNNKNDTFHIMGQFLHK
jgi:hypothetical protein